MLFGRNSALFFPEEAAGGGAGAATPPGDNGNSDFVTGAQVQDLINKAFAAFGKRDLPALFEQQFTKFGTQVRDSVIEGLVGQIPSDEELQRMEEEEAARAAASGKPPGEGQPGAIDPQVNAMIRDLQNSNRKLQEQLQTMQHNAEEAEQRAEWADRTSQISAALNKYPFTSDAARAMAFNHVLAQVDRAEDGSLIANDLPLPQFVDDMMGSVTGLLQPKPVSGAGASASSAKGGPQFKMEDITPDMKPEQRDAFMQQAASLLGAVQGGAPPTPGGPKV